MAGTVARGVAAGPRGFVWQAQYAEPLERSAARGVAARLVAAVILAFAAEVSLSP